MRTIGPHGPNDDVNGNPVPARRKQFRDKDGRRAPRNPAKDIALHNFFDHMDRATFLEACGAASDERFQALSQALAFSRISLPRLTREFGITLTELYTFWRDHQQSSGMIRMMNHVPDVLENVGEDAKSRDFTCWKCDGAGKLTVKGKRGAKAVLPSICSECHGTGTVRVEGSAKARDLVFESLGLTGKRSPLVAQQFNIGADETLESMVSTAQKLLTRRDAVETTATAVADEGA